MNLKSFVFGFRGERRFEKPLRRDVGRGGFEEGGAAGRKDYARSDSDNWRTLREEQEDMEGAEPGGCWRIAGARREGTHVTCWFVKNSLKKKTEPILFYDF